MSTPIISVLMSVHNGSTFLKEAIDSILNQTFLNWEFIIINDASNDNTEKIISLYSDERIVYLKNKNKLGLASSLNKGIRISKGKYLARMDDDDISRKDRLEKQYNFLEKKLEIGVLGSYVKVFGSKNCIRKHSSDSIDLKIKSIFSCQFCHSSVMIRKSVLTENNINYNEKFLAAQDYELWSRIMPFTDFSTIPEVLLEYRVHKNQISLKKKELQLKNNLKVKFYFLKKIGVEASLQNVNNLKLLSDFSFHNKSFKLEDISGFLLLLIAANKKTLFLNQNRFSSFCGEFFYNICKFSEIKRVKKLKIYHKSGLKKYFNPRLATLKLLLK